MRAGIWLLSGLPPVAGVGLKSASQIRGEMRERFLQTLARFAIGTSYVFAPMSKLFHTKKIVKCPETDELAEILVDTTPGTSAKPKKKRFSIRSCSLWPQKKDCTRSCEK